MLITACASVPSPVERKAVLEENAAVAGMTPAIVETKRFDLYSLARTSVPSDLLVVYIEGDGLVWIRRGERSSDPTPINPVAMHLAAADPAPMVAYLGRPCQYAGGLNARNCDDALWTSARYGEDVVQSINEALDNLKAGTGAKRLGLAGYSGGGTIAALVAMRRDDVAWLKTIASPLDTDAFATLHKVMPLRESLNPADNAAALSDLPQIHYMGANDETVPPSVNRTFMARLNDTRCAALTVAPHIGHQEGWREFWASGSLENPSCR
ncbi:MAG: hypothetical protein RLO15_08340 [Parvibaculum sp.]